MSKTRALAEVLILTDQCRLMHSAGSKIQALRNNGSYRCSCAAMRALQGGFAQLRSGAATKDITLAKGGIVS